MPSIGEPGGYPDGGIWPTTGQVTFGGAISEVKPAMGAAVVGGGATVLVVRRELATMLECCRVASAAAGRVTFGSATWAASPKTDGDSLARYYPLGLNVRDVYDANIPIPRGDVLAALKASGRDIAHQVTAGASGVLADSENGKMCEVPEQFRLGRYYDVPLTTSMDPQPQDGLGELPTSVVIKQWEWSRGFTASMLYRYRPVRQEQSLFSLSPAVRWGVSWLGELAVEISLENGDKLRKWSTQRLSVDDWSHIAFAFDPLRKAVRVYLNGVVVLDVAFTRAVGAVDGCYVGRWDGGSLMNGDAQDVRIYDSVLRTEFVAAEVNSYCADWVEVVA